MSRGAVSRSISKEVMRSGSQSQEAWRRIDGREDCWRGSQSRHNSVRRSASRDLDSRRSKSKDKEAERRSISKGLRSIGSKSRERSQLEKIEESSEEEVDTWHLRFFHHISLIQEEDEETIVAKRRLERLKRLAKVKPE